MGNVWGPQEAFWEHTADDEPVGLSARGPSPGLQKEGLRIQVEMLLGFSEHVPGKKACDSFPGFGHSTSAAFPPPPSHNLLYLSPTPFFSLCLLISLLPSLFLSHSLSPNTPVLTILFAVGIGGFTRKLMQYNSLQDPEFAWAPTKILEKDPAISRFLKQNVQK